MENNGNFIKEGILCKSLGGLDVPLITISSRINTEPRDYVNIKLEEFNEATCKLSTPLYKKKK